MIDHAQYEPIPTAIALLTGDGGILPERLSSLLAAYSDVEPEAAPAGCEHAPVEHGPFIPLMVQAGAVPAQPDCALQYGSPQFEITVTEGHEDDFYERLERLLRESRAAQRDRR